MSEDASGGVGVPARAAALRVTDAVLRRGLPLETALDRAAQGLAAPDRALVHALAAEVLRRLPDLDTLIDGATARPLPPDAKARAVLRLALAQALRLGTPPHAAIATLLPLVDGGPRRLVHGVFGTLMRRGAMLPEPPTLPAAIAERWTEQWGGAVVAAAARAIAAPPPLDLTLRDPASTDDWTARLGGVSLAPGHVRLPPGTSVAALEGYAEGTFWVQDLAASLPARLLGPGAGAVLDLCAAPGGKTMQLAAAGWRVIAIDAAPARLARVRVNLARTRLPAEMLIADALTYVPPAPADAVLLDAPCSATGIFRRHPDVLHRARPAAFEALAERQRAMLARAAAALRPGGRLVYAVCSLERAEGEDVAEAFLAATPSLVADPVDRAELPPGLVPDAEGRVRVLPGTLEAEGGADGFFVARFRKR